MKKLMFGTFLFFAAFYVYAMENKDSQKSNHKTFLNKTAKKECLFGLLGEQTVRNMPGKIDKTVKQLFKGNSQLSEECELWYAWKTMVKVANAASPNT